SLPLSQIEENSMKPTQIEWCRGTSEQGTPGSVTPMSPCFAGLICKANMHMHQLGLGIFKAANQSGHCQVQCSSKGTGRVLNECDCLLGASVSAQALHYNRKTS